MYPYFYAVSAGRHIGPQGSGSTAARQGIRRTVFKNPWERLSPQELISRSSYGTAREESPSSFLMPDGGILLFSSPYYPGGLEHIEQLDAAKDEGIALTGNYGYLHGDAVDFPYKPTDAQMRTLSLYNKLLEQELYWRLGAIQKEDIVEGVGFNNLRDKRNTLKNPDGVNITILAVVSLALLKVVSRAT